MKTGVLLAASLLGWALLSGCGTIFTRGNHAVFGAYPFHAVGFDCVLLSQTFKGPQDALGMEVSGSLFLLVGLVSLPFDMAIDAVACPLDVVAWLLGYHKFQPGPVRKPPA